MQFHLVTAHEQPQIRHADRFDGGRAEQRAVEQRRDSRQQILAGALGPQLTHETTPHQPAAQRERQPVRLVEIAHHGRYLGQTVFVGARQQGREHVPVLRASVVVGEPEPVGARRQRMQHPERETACAAQVSARADIRGCDGLAGDQVAHPLVVIVVDDHDVVDGAALGGQGVQRLGQLVGTAMGDQHGENGLQSRVPSALRASGSSRGSRAFSSRTSRTWRAASSPS